MCASAVNELRDLLEMMARDKQKLKDLKRAKHHLEDRDTLVGIVQQRVKDCAARKAEVLAELRRAFFDADNTSPILQSK
jgi:hypothetical protein